MTEHLTKELLKQYLDGMPLTGEQDSHLLECVECTAVLGTLLGV